MISHDAAAVLPVNGEMSLLTHGDAALNDSDLVGELAGSSLYGVEDLGLAAGGGYEALVAHLSAALSVEGGLCGNDVVDLAVAACVVNELFLGGDVGNRAVVLEPAVAGELGVEGLVHFQEHGILGAHVL